MQKCTIFTDGPVGIEGGWEGVLAGSDSRNNVYMFDTCDLALYVAEDLRLPVPCGWVACTVEHTQNRQSQLHLSILTECTWAYKKR